jgi:zinc protease
MAAAQTELRRFAAYGPTAQEMKDALHDLQNTYWNVHKGEEVGDSSTIAAALADALSQGGPIPGNDADRVFDRATAGLSIDEVRAAFSEDWSGTGARIAFVTTAPPAAGALTAAWAAGEAGPTPAAATTVAAVAWPYQSFGKSGTVVAREAFPALDMVKLTFANGVVAYVKPQNTEAERRVTVNVSFGAGRHGLTADQAFVASLGGQLTPFMGLQRIGYDDMKRALQDTNWNIDFDIGDTQDSMVGTTWPADLKTELQVLAAFASEPGFRPDLDASLAPALNAGVQLMRSNPSAAVQVALSDALRPGQPSLVPNDARLAAMRATDFRALLRPDLTADPLQVVVVGSIDEKTVTPMLAATFGALPPRAAVDRTRADAWFMRGLDKPLSPITVTLPGAKTAAVGAVWPLWQADPAHRREEMAMQMAGRILGDVLRKRVREQLGKTYSPAVEVSLPDEGDQGMALALVDTAPGDLDQVRAEITAAAAGVAAGQFDQDALDRARTPFLAQTDQTRTLNLWWAGLIAVTHGDPEKINEMVGERDIVASLTLTEVKAAAKRWLSRPPTLITAVPESPGAQASAKP